MKERTRARMGGTDDNEDLNERKNFTDTGTMESGKESMRTGGSVTVILMMKRMEESKWQTGLTTTGRKRQTAGKDGERSGTGRM